MNCKIRVFLQDQFFLNYYFLFNITEHRFNLRKFILKDYFLALCKLTLKDCGTGFKVGFNAFLFI